MDIKVLLLVKILFTIYFLPENTRFMNIRQWISVVAYENKKKLNVLKSK